MDYELGKVYTLKVLRQTPLGYMLELSDEDVFMHQYQAKGDLNEGDEVEVFLYLDHKKRLTATMEMPRIQLGEAGLLEVVSVDKSLGAHLDNGVTKDLLISSNDLPFDYDLWPKPGDRIMTRIKLTSTQMIGRVVNRANLGEYFEEPRILNIGEFVDAYCIKSGEEGTNFVTEDGNHIFVHANYRRGKHRLGEKANVKIIKALELGEYNGTVTKNKLKMLTKDAEEIYDYMVQLGGEMSLHDKSDAEEIKQAFNLSKSAFKRALGTLLKNNRVERLDHGYKIKE